MTLDFADQKIAVLGAGKMGGILLEGLVRNGYTSRTLRGPSLAFPPGRQCPAEKLVESLNNKRGSYRSRQAAASSVVPRVACEGIARSVSAGIMACRPNIGATGGARTESVSIRSR
jgi:pyrroline-5-carboxylate reductase